MELQEEIYEPDSVKILSRHKNLIGFKFEVAHLRGALRAASNSEAESTEIKLAIKSKVYGAEVQGTQQKPFLCLTSKGMSSNITQEIPIGLPLTAPGRATKPLCRSLTLFLLACQMQIDWYESRYLHVCKCLQLRLSFKMQPSCCQRSSLEWASQMHAQVTVMLCRIG